MGRMRIKKKSAVIPFTETLAFRMIIVIALAVGFLIASFQALGAYRAGGFSTTTIVWGLASLIAVAGVLYNMERLKHARVPAATLKRMKRRP
jgi:hypothetical protein